MWTYLIPALAMCGLLAIVAEGAPGPAAMTHTGMVVSAGNGTLTMKGDDGKQHSHDIGPNVMVMIRGKPGKLEELQTGEMIRVTMQVDGKVTEVATIDMRK